MTDNAPGLTIGVRSLAYQGTTLFENLRFRLDGSSWTCLLGASGVGKTSLLRLIAGLAPGALVVADDGRGLDQRVALMAQQDLLLPWLPVVDNVLLVTHNPLEALRLGHRLYVLGGRPALPRGPLIPRGTPPRDAADPTLLALQAELLGELTRSSELLEAS